MNLTENRQFLQQNIKDDKKGKNNIDKMNSTQEASTWMEKFKELCFSIKNSDESLTNLMTYFIRNVRQSVNECQTKPLRADKLKGFISENLLLFLFYNKSQEKKCSNELHKNSIMSDLLAMYIDMELKASKKSNEEPDQISARLTSYLCIYLDYSAEDLIDTLFKIKLMSSTYYQILHPLISQILRIIPEHPSSSLMYVRYFLLFRLWKRISKELEAKNEVTRKALSSLDTCPTSFPQYIMDHVLPNIPKVPNTPNIITTKQLFSQYVDLEKSCKSFVEFTRKSKGVQLYADEQVNDTDKFNKPEENLTLKLINENSSSNSNNINLTSRINDKSKNINDNSNTKLKQKLGKVIVVDLTDEDSISGKVVKHNNLNKKCSLSWTKKLLKCKSSNKLNIKEDNNFTEDLKRLEKEINSSLQINLEKDDEFNLEEMDESKQEKQRQQQYPVAAFENNSTSNETVQLKSPLINNFESEKTVPIIDVNADPACSNVNTLESNIVSSKNEEPDKILPDENELKSEVQEQVLVQSFKDDKVCIELNNGIKIPKLNNNNNIISIKKSEELTSLEYRESPQNVNNINNSTNLQLRSDSNLNTNIANLNSNEYCRNTVLHLNQNIGTNSNKTKLKYSDEYLDNNTEVDGLSLLASVSQSILNLSKTPINNSTKELIKVKNYSNLMIQSENNTELKINNTNKKDDDIFEDKENKMNDNNDMNKFISMYPDDVNSIDRVAFHVEISSTEDTSQQYAGTLNFNLDNPCTYLHNESQIELPSNTTIQDNKDQHILNGETIVLLQKSPNSNLYIINKADQDNHMISDKLLQNKLDNYDNVNDNITSDKNDIIDSNSFIYSDNIYHCNNQSLMSLKDSKKYSKIKIDIDSDIMKSPKRRKIKQEFGLTNQLCNKNCSQVDSNINYHNHNNYSSNEMYRSYRQNFNPITCGLPINHSQRCSWLNCNCNIVTHCDPYIIPKNEATVDLNNDKQYYIPLQKPSSPSPSPSPSLPSSSSSAAAAAVVMQNNSSHHKNNDERFYSCTEINNKLPLKKRYKSIPSDFDENIIKKENNYPGTPMISIAALENLIDGSQVYFNETKKKNFKKDNSNNFNNSDKSKKRKYSDMNYYSNNNNNNSNDDEDDDKNVINNSIDSEQLVLVKPSKKVKESKLQNKVSARRTRSSLRKLPKINYSYVDDETEKKNSSQESKRKKKKTR